MSRGVVLITWFKQRGFEGYWILFWPTQGISSYTRTQIYVWLYDIQHNDNSLTSFNRDVTTRMILLKTTTWRQTRLQRFVLMWCNTFDFNLYFSSLIILRSFFSFFVWLVLDALFFNFTCAFISKGKLQ